MSSRISDCCLFRFRCRIISCPMARRIHRYTRGGRRKAQRESYPPVARQRSTTKRLYSLICKCVLSFFLRYDFQTYMLSFSGSLSVAKNSSKTCVGTSLLARSYNQNKRTTKTYGCALKEVTLQPPFRRHQYTSLFSSSGGFFLGAVLLPENA